MERVRLLMDEYFVQRFEKSYCVCLQNGIQFFETAGTSRPTKQRHISEDLNL